VIKLGVIKLGLIKLGLIKLGLIKLRNDKIIELRSMDCRGRRPHTAEDGCPHLRPPKLRPLLARLIPVVIP
jgi:hypothetical protein